MEKLLWAHGQTFPRVWSPSIFDNGEASKSMEKEVRDFYQDGQRLLYDDDSDQKSGTTIFFIDGRELSPDMNKIKKDKEVNSDIR